MKALAEENRYVVVYVPKNMTDQFQPLDLTVNGKKVFAEESFAVFAVLAQIAKVYSRKIF